MTSGSSIPNRARTGRRLTLPSPEEVRRFAGQYDAFADPGIQAYLNIALDRLIYTLRLMREIPLERPRVLEIGAHPYFMTMLMHVYLGYEVTALNEPRDSLPATGSQVFRNQHTGEEATVPYACANVEFDEFPWESGSFNLVVFTEVIEHLTYDPTHSLAEIHRVLKDGGYMVLSTPNALRWEYLRKMIRGKNYYPPYSGYGTTARHNREFSVDELSELLEGCGFEISTIQTVRDAAYDHPALWEKGVRVLNKLGFWRDRLDVIHLVARARGKPRLAYPEHLYYDTHAYGKIRSSEVIVGVNDALQIESATFYRTEDLPPKVRWTKQDAVVFLRGDGQSKLRIRFLCGGRSQPITVTVLSDGRQIGRVESPPDEWVEAEFPLPEPARGVIRVTLHVDDVFVPARESPSSVDTRELGIALQWIRLE